MSSKENKGNRIRGILMILALLMLTAVFSAANVRQAQAATDPKVVKTARKNKVSKGKWVKKAKGIRYKKKNGTYIKSQWCVIDGNVYYFNDKGYVQTGSFQYKGCYYYADSNGKLYIKKFLKKGGKVYYYGATGARLQAKWKKISGKTYYFDRTGKMVTNSWVGNSYVGKDGAKVVNKTVQGRKINKAGEVKNLAKTDNCIFIGASRIVDMSSAVSGKGTVFIAKSGAGYDWMRNTAASRLNSYLKKNPRCTVVFMLGHNDLSNVDAYIRYYRALIKKYPKAHFYFADVLPKTSEKTKINAARVAFNQKMRAAFGNKCISAEAYLKSQGCLYKTVDGTHYSTKVSRLLYNYIMRQVKKLNAGESSSSSSTQTSTETASGSQGGLGVLVDN